MMDHDAIVELSGAYVLGAVTREEARTVHEHLSECTACSEIIADLRTTARLLPLSCDSVSPSAELKPRILRLAQAEVKAQAMLRRNVRGSDASADSARLRFTAPWARSWVAAAAAVFLIGGGFAVGTMQARSAAAQQMVEMQTQLALERSAKAEIAADAKIVHGVVADAAHGKVWDRSGGRGAHWWHCMLVQPPNKKNATLIASVPRAPHGMKYQAWIIHKGTMHRAPVLPDGVAMIEMPMPLETGDVVAFSMEPPNGSARPTSPLVMMQTL